MEIASSAWQVISAAIVFLMGAAIAVGLAHRFNASHRRALFLYLWHTAFCVIYFWYAQHNVSDAYGYFQIGLQGPVTFAAGSAAVEMLAYFCATILGLSFLGTFLVYQIFGYIGLLAFDASLRAATAGKAIWIRRLALLIVILPSVNFWSAAIGKDALAFMATGLALWAALKLKQRTWIMIAAVLIMLMVRPHIAGIMVMAVAGSQMLQRRIPLIHRLILGSVALAATAAIIPFALDYAGVGRNADQADIMNYVDQRQVENLGGTSSVDIASMSLPQMLFTYLFRPLPIEAASPMSLAAAMDNIILLLLALAGLWKVIVKRRSSLPGNRTFMWLYFMGSWVLLAATTANLGISVRQKWMFAPMLIFLCLSLLGKRRTRASPRVSLPPAP